MYRLALKADGCFYAQKWDGMMDRPRIDVQLGSMRLEAALLEAARLFRCDKKWIETPAQTEARMAARRMRAELIQERIER